MQVLLLGLFVALYLHDVTTEVAKRSADGSVRRVEALPVEAWPYLGPAQVALIVLGPKLLLAVYYALACKQTRRRLGTERGEKAIKRLDRLTSALPLLLLGLFVMDLWMGALRVVRLAIQHTVLIDELAVLLPTLGVAVFAWAAYYPIDRRLREAAIFRLADEGRPIYPLQTRGQYLSMQLRHQFGLLLLPLLIIFAWSESLVLLGPDHKQILSENAALAMTPLGVLIVFVLAPLIVRHVWHTAPLPAGEVRDRMLALCQQHKVRVRELLLWRTGGGMVNAAVTGLIRQVRFILLSDGLLDQVPPRAVEAVMAHELAHVKCKHIVWMGLVLIVTLGLIEHAGYLALDLTLGPIVTASQRPHAATAPLIDLNDPSVRMLVVAVPAFMLTMVVFGWVSRRIERQADVFAARHLALTTDDKQHDELARPVFDQASIDTMAQALQSVAVLNHVSADRPSWRHGSIAWRQAHLRSLTGIPIHNTPVDQTLGRVKLITLIGLAILVTLYFTG